MDSMRGPSSQDDRRDTPPQRPQALRCGYPTERVAYARVHRRRGCGENLHPCLYMRDERAPGVVKDGKIVTLIISAGNITECSVIPALRRVEVSLVSDLAPVPEGHSPMLLLTCGPEKHEVSGFCCVLKFHARTPRPAFGERPS